MSERESVRVLEECIDLQQRKSRDYQNDKSNVKQAMHYRRGVATIHDMISQKLLRAQSLLEAYENGDIGEPNFEGLEDTYKDLINYASFAVSYLRHKMEGQQPYTDMLNRPLHEGYGMVDEYIPETNVKPLTREEWDKAVDALEEHQPEDKPRYKISTIEDEEPLLPKVRKITKHYVDRVHPVGPILTAPGIRGNIDSVAESYIEEIAAPRVEDIGHRIDEDMEDHRRATKSQGQ